MKIQKAFLMILVIATILISFSSAGEFPNPNFEDKSNAHILKEGDNIKIYVPGAAGNSAWAPNIGGVAFCTDNAQYLTQCGTSADGYWGIMVGNNQKIPINSDFFNKIYNPLIQIKNQISIDPYGENNELIVNNKNEIISGRMDVQSSQIDVGQILYPSENPAPIVNIIGTINFDSGEIIISNGGKYSKNNFKVGCKNQYNTLITTDKINLESLGSNGAIRIPFSTSSIATCNSKYLEEFYPLTRIWRTIKGVAPQGTILNWLTDNRIGKAILGRYSSTSDDLCINSDSQFMMSFDQCSSRDVKEYSFVPSYGYLNLYASSNDKLGGYLCSLSGGFTIDGQDVSNQCINLVDGSIPSFTVSANNDVQVDKLAYIKEGKDNYNLPVLYEEKEMIQEINSKYSNLEIAYLTDATDIGLIKTS